VENTLRIIFLKGHVFNAGLVGQPAAGLSHMHMPFQTATAGRNSAAAELTRLPHHRPGHISCYLRLRWSKEEEERGQDESCLLGISWFKEQADNNHY